MKQRYVQVQYITHLYKQECKAKMSLLQDLEEIYHALQGRCSDLEADKAKLQASQRFAEELEAENDDYKGKLSNANELIMQHLSSQVGVIL